MARAPTHSPRHPAPQRRRVGWLAQLTGILIAPAAWVAQMALSAMTITRGCHAANLPLMLVSAGCFLIGAAATFVAWRSWRKSADEAEGRSRKTLEVGEGRTRFLALLSICTNGMFLAAMAFTASSFLLIAPCEKSVVNPAFTQADIAKGAYLARVGDCASCHSAPGMPAYAGGFAIHAPIGTIYGTNITPDPTYGIGAYNLRDFDRALRHGESKDGHFLYPAMPYTSFAYLNDADVKALYAYFYYGVAPVAMKPAQQTQLFFPLNQRWGIRFWNWLFLHRGVYQPRADKDATWNRGAYLVEGLGHCGGCHTPRNIAYAEEATSDTSGVYLSGTDVDNWHAANLRGDRVTGLGQWQAGDISNFLKTGNTAGIHAMGSMVQVVENSGQYMNDADRLAIARYLKSLDPKGEGATMSVPVADVFERPGAGLYAQDCSGCHGLSGEGKPGFPRLSGNPAVLSASATSLIHIVLIGGASPRTEGQPVPRTMPAFGGKLTDREIADVLSYTRQSFGNHAGAVTEPQVRALRAKLR